MKGIMRVSAILLIIILALPVFAVGNNEAEDSTGEVVLNFPTFWVGQDSKAESLSALVDEFNNMNAGEIQVVIEPNPDTDGYRDKLNTQFASKSVPDIFVFNPDPTTFQYYASDALFDFTDEMTNDWREDFVESYLIDSTKNGRLKSIPYEIGITPVWYNADSFAKAGVPSFPENWDDFVAAAKKLKAIGIVPSSQMTGGANAWTSMLWFSHIMGSIGGPDVWSRPLTDPIYVKGAEYLRQLYVDGNTTRDAVGGDAGVSGGHYMAGNTATFINGPWYVGRIKGDAPEVHATTMLAPIPKIGEYYGHQIGFMLSNLAAGNTDDPRRRAAVVAFMKFMTKPENVKRVSENAGSLFATKYELSNNSDSLQKEFVSAASNATFVIGHFQSQMDVAVVQEFGQALAAMALGEASPQEFVQMLIDAQ